MGHELETQLLLTRSLSKDNIHDWPSNDQMQPDRQVAVRTPHSYDDEDKSGLVAQEGKFAGAIRSQ